MEKLYYNAMESLVEQNLDKYMKHLDCCTCEQCRADVMCMALNHLQPHYVSTTKGALYVKLDNLQQQLGADITKQLTAAISRVKINPGHPTS